MKRKMIAFITALALSMSLSACGKDDTFPPEEETRPAGTEETVQIESESELAEAEETEAEEAEQAVATENTTTLSDLDVETYEKIIEELDQYIEEQNFIRLFKVYKEYKEEYATLSNKLEEHKALYIKQITSLFDEWIEDADSFVVSADMENAYKKIDSISEIINMTSHFKELEDYQDILNERLNYYVNYNAIAMPVDLMGKEFDMVNRCYYKDETKSANPGPYADKIYFIDRYGNVYKKYYELQVPSTNTDRPTPYVIFNADNQYNIFHCEFVCHNLMKEYNQFHIEVYGDDIQLYLSDSFTSYNEPMMVDIDITGYKLIKFVAVREDYNILWGEGRVPSVGLYNANFSHSEVPEFEYYKSQNQE